MKNAHLLGYSAAGFVPAGLGVHDGVHIHRAAAAVLQKHGAVRPTHLNRAAVIVIVRRRHAEHLKLGGTQPLPEVAPLNRRQICACARSLESANAVLRKGGAR